MYRCKTLTNNNLDAEKAKNRYQQSVTQVRIRSQAPPRKNLLSGITPILLKIRHEMFTLCFHEV